jgi:hypothetical protein
MFYIKNNLIILMLFASSLVSSITRVEESNLKTEYRSFPSKVPNMDMVNKETGLTFNEELPQGSKSEVEKFTSSKQKFVNYKVNFNNYVYMLSFYVIYTILTLSYNAPLRSETFSSRLLSSFLFSMCGAYTITYVICNYYYNFTDEENS